jgi:ureidoacrylate peracid hydrolase
MHQVTVRPEIRERVLKRRGRYHIFERLDPRRTALIAIDMQGTFCAPGGPAEVPGSRGIVRNLNALTAELRALGVPVIWILHANARQGATSDWDLFFDHFVGGEVRDQTIQSLAPGRQAVWADLATSEQDVTLFKNRYSALISGSSELERVLRDRGIDTILIAGTKTNVCCEATARDAMMLGFRVVMVEDCCAALSDEEHRSALENVIQQFGDVMTSDMVRSRLQAEQPRPDGSPGTP